MEKFEKFLRYLKILGKEKSQAYYPDEVGLIEKYIEEYDNFILNLFKKGYTHIGYGDSHSSRKIHSYLNGSIPKLRKEGGLGVICLELLQETQEAINGYIETGDMRYIQEVIDIEISKKRPWTKELIETNYFDVIKISRENGVEIVAMDKLEGNRDRIMASQIPVDRKTLIYVGQAHLMRDSIPIYFKVRTGVCMFRVWNFLSQDSGYIERWLESVVEQSEKLRRDRGFGLNLKRHNLYYVLNRHVLSEIFGSSSKHLDGLIYHQ